MTKNNNFNLKLTISKEQIKDWLIDAYKTKNWSQINKLIVLLGGVGKKII